VHNFDEQIVETPICKNYTTDLLFSQANAYSLKYVIVIINYIIGKVVQMIITSVGCSSESSRLQYITSCIFVCQFFNTGFLVMLVNANLNGQGWILGKIFNGSESDFSLRFFTTTGDILVGSMMFNTWFPVMMEFGWFGYRVFFRVLDQVGLSGEQKTRKITLQQYINTYAGPVWFIQWKYSSILNIVYVTLTFGMGLPLLFPLAAVQMLVIYCLEKYMIYYLYQEPPAYDEVLSNSVLRKLTRAPLFMIAFAYWMLTNRQLIQNDNLFEIPTHDTPFQAKHYWWEALTKEGVFGSGPAGFLLPYLILFLVFLSCRPLFTLIAKKCCGRVLLSKI
jgi:hypothetical protein